MRRHDLDAFDHDSFRRLAVFARAISRDGSIPDFFEDIGAFKRARVAMDDGKPLPMALREARIWGDKERAFEAVLPGVDSAALARLVDAASTCDGLVKGRRHPGWPDDPWDGLRRLVLMTLDLVATARAGRRGPQPAALALRPAP